MKGKMILTAAAAAFLGGSPLSAQINSPEASGYLQRGVEMYRNRNYTGCIDQMLQLRKLNPTSEQSREAFYYLAMSTLYTGNDEAIVLFDEWLRLYPESPLREDVEASAGDYYFTRGKYAEALARYDKVAFGALTSDRASDCIYRQAYSNLMLARYDEAEAGFKSIENAGGQYAGAVQFYLGYIAYRREDYAAAKAYFEKSLSDADLGAAANYYLAQINYMDGNYAEALKCAQAALSGNVIESFAPEANRIAGESLYNLGREDEAVPYLWRYAADATEVHPSAYYILGVSEYKQGNYESAIKLLSKVTDQDNEMGQSANLFLGQSYVKEGNPTSALMAFERAYKRNYDRAISETALYNYAIAKMEGGKIPFGSSVALFEDFLSRYPDSRYAEKVQEYIISGYVTDNEYDKALQSINKMKNPSAKVIEAKQRVLFMLGTREYGAGKYSDALTHFSDASRIRSNDEIALQSLIWSGNCNYEMKQYDKAASEFNAYIKQTRQGDPNRTLAYYNLGYARLAQSKFGDALNDFRQVISARPTPEKSMLADAYDRAGDCLYYQSKFAEAEAEYRKAYDLNPEAGDYALYQLAIMKGLTRDYKGKISAIDDLISRFPSSGLVPASLLEKAESYVAIGENGKAIDTYTELVRTYPATSYGRQGYLQLAITNMNQGKREDAIDAYKQVITTYPTSDEARIATDDLKRIFADEGRLSDFAQFVNSVPNAPKIEASELDAIAFQSAEKDYINNDNTEKLTSYIAQYPNGAYEAQALYYLATAASDAGDSEKAYEYASKLAASHPDAEMVDDALLIKADAEIERGNDEVAYETYVTLESKASGARNLQEARLGILRTAGRLGKYEDVLSAADKLLSTTAAGGKESSEIKYMRGLALEQTGKPDGAIAEWKALAGNVDDEYGARSAVKLGELLLTQGNVKEARKVIDAFINANPPQQYWLARGFIVFSDVLRAEGNDFEANEYLKSLKANYPGAEADIFQMIEERIKE